MSALVAEEQMCGESLTSLAPHCHCICAQPRLVSGAPSCVKKMNNKNLPVHLLINTGMPGLLIFKDCSFSVPVDRLLELLSSLI